MVAIQGYDRVVIRQGQVADTVNTQAISEAAAGFNALAQTADAAAQVSLKIREADDTATLNEMLITREREKIDFIEQAKKQYEGMPDGFSRYVEKSMQERDSKTIAALPERLKQPYRMTTLESNVRDYKQNLGWETDRRVAVVGDKISRAGTQTASLAYTYGTTGQPLEEVMKQVDATMVAGSGVLAPEKLTKFDEDLRSEVAKQYIAGLAQADPKAAQDLINSGSLNKYMTPEALVEQSKKVWEATPDLLKIEQIKSKGSPLDVIMKNEGGYVAQDGKSGHPAIFGINEGSYPKEFKEAKRIYDEQGKAAGEQYAREFYQREIIEKRGVDKLPAEVQTIVADGLVNHWSGFQDTLLNAAKNGATPQELIQLRKNEYDRLVKANPEKYGANYQGWMNRLQSLSGNTAFDSLSYGEKINEIDKINKAIASDPANAAIQYGATTPQEIVDVQVGLGIKPQNASVMRNAEAADLAQHINQVETVDEIYSIATSLNQQYGNYTYNAIADLKAKGKMKPAMEGALILATKGNPEYKEHIELLAQIGKSGEKAVSSLFSANGYSTKDLNVAISEQTQDWQIAVRNEGREISEIQEKLAITASLAQARMAKVLDGDFEGAAEFATKPEFDAYTIADVNGLLRVPNKYSADAIESALEDAINETLPQMIQGADSADYVFSKDVTPFLSPDEDGYLFRAPSGEVVADKNGAPILLTFDSLLAAKQGKDAQPSLLLKFDSRV